MQGLLLGFWKKMLSDNDYLPKILYSWGKSEQNLTVCIVNMQNQSAELAKTIGTLFKDMVLQKQKVIKIVHIKVYSTI